MNQICSEGKRGGGGKAGAMVFAEVGNLIRRKIKIAAVLENHREG